MLRLRRASRTAVGFTWMVFQSPPQLAVAYALLNKITHARKSIRELFNTYLCVSKSSSHFIQLLNGYQLAQRLLAGVQGAGIVPRRKSPGLFPIHVRWGPLHSGKGLGYDEESREDGDQSRDGNHDGFRCAA